MPDEDIGQLTLLEYDALIRRKQADDRRERLNTGLIAACILNSAPFGDPNRKAYQPSDFVPELQAEEAAKCDLTKMNPEQQRDFLMNLFTKGTMREK